MHPDAKRELNLRSQLEEFQKEKDKLIMDKHQMQEKIKVLKKREDRVTAREERVTAQEKNFERILAKLAEGPLRKKFWWETEMEKEKEAKENDRIWLRERLKWPVPLNGNSVKRSWESER